MPESPKERKSASLSRPEELVDRTIGEFRLLRRLGAGGMADVYLAEQPSLERVVAVKVLQPERIAGFDSSIVDRFEREAKAAGGLNHSNIVQVYQTGEEDGIHFIVQEYIQGNNLSQQIRRVGPPELHQGLQWMQQIAAALHAASEAGIVHRDIKPENIMLTRELTAKVTDFGLAQLNQPGDEKNLTQTGTAMGTPLYMSPEQIRGQKVDHRSDQYSFGVTCYHMFAGRPPFSAGNSVTVAVQHLQDSPPPLAGHRADLPPGLCEMIHRMMAKDPSDRFQSTREMLDAIAPLHDLSVNTSLRTATGALDWMKLSLLGWPKIAAALAITAAAGALAGTLMTASYQLEVAPINTDYKTSAEEQFAAAMLDSNSESAWLAINEYHPDSEEWRYAQLHLAMLYLRHVPPDVDRAQGVLEELVTWTTVSQDYRQLRALALVASAMIARRTGNKATENSYLDQLRKEDLVSDEERENLSEIAPRLLRNYWNRLPPPGGDGGRPRRL
jgi:serine/threonine protein kinase